MSTLRLALAVGAALLAAAPSADAQLRRSPGAAVPDASTMPAGTCRVWIDGVHPMRQPAPTDCASARRSVPRNARIIYGTRAVRDDDRLDRDRRERERDRDEWDRKREHEREKLQRKREHEREKLERKREKEREKEWKKEHRGNGRHRNGNDRDGVRDDRDDDEDDDDRDDDRRAQRTTTRFPVPVPQTTPPTGSTTRRVCVDANRDGRCDDGGPLVRVTP